MFSAFSVSVHRPHRARGFRLKAYGPAILLVLGLFSLACAGPIHAVPGAGEVARSGTDGSVGAESIPPRDQLGTQPLLSSTYIPDYQHFGILKIPQPDLSMKEAIADMFFEKAGIRVTDKTRGVPKMSKDNKIRVVLISENGEEVMKAEIWLSSVYWTSMQSIMAHGPTKMGGIIHRFNAPTDVV
ncbi:hypothetical protein EV361DRAFT_922050 [Lentinula raphanica]|nr:hypothetical protein EV361DRAFT_922050 [Lentinula raphanica]